MAKKTLGDTFLPQYIECISITAKNISARAICFKYS